ncbi:MULTISPECIES: hypothetical protein [unclassified Acidovorax]|uniref:hypothetical protein n=1 Tax=unclassified Acidovorax TaxID=2684926 RepID=UPI001C48EFA8|nr:MULTISPECIES: hypothetical protein [unclassified Acidovorax]MBV7428056.1 hypothetical protein [Acidovorax sp. sif0732]MBV7449313.1 hypothetical protein [Acidovorax sp. sif0715]
MKFRSPSDQPIHVALTTGHTASIPPEGVELDPMFHREASARGAVAFDDTTTIVMTPDVRKAAISAALKGMLDGAAEGDFTAEGKPNLLRLKAAVGFSVSRDEADAVFTELTAKV